MKVNGSICQKKYLANDFLGRKIFPSIIIYEDGLQTQHEKCGRAKIWYGIPGAAGNCSKSRFRIASLKNEETPPRRQRSYLQDNLHALIQAESVRPVSPAAQLSLPHRKQAQQHPAQVRLEPAISDSCVPLVVTSLYIHHEQRASGMPFQFSLL